MRYLLALIVSGFFLQPLFAEEAVVPGIGSVWKSTSVSAGNAETGSSGRTWKNSVTVERMREGRPVFAGELRGFKGEIFQTKDGAVAYEYQCEYNVPMEKFEPPVVPNQCGWHVCSAPPIGEVFIRKMVVYALLLGCGPSDAVYTFESVRTDKFADVPVTVGNAEITLVGTSMGRWQSYIRDGDGEVHAESSEQITTYDEVKVLPVPYKRMEMAAQTE